MCNAAAIHCRDCLGAIGRAENVRLSVGTIELEAQPVCGNLRKAYKATSREKARSSVSLCPPTCTTPTTFDLPFRRPGVGLRTRDPQALHGVAVEAGHRRIIS